MYRIWRCTALRRQQENNTIHKIGNHPVIKRSSQVLRASEGAEPPAQRRSQPQWSIAALVQSCSQPPSAILKQSAALQSQHNTAASHGRPPKHGGHGRPPKPGHGKPPRYRRVTILGVTRSEGWPYWVPPGQKGDILGHYKNTRNLMTPSFLGSPVITLKICS